MRLVGARETSAGVRATAAYGVAVVARKNAEALKAVDVNQACAVLKAVVDAGGASADDDDDDETKSRAVENAANAVAAVADALYAPDSTERQQLVGWWLGALPFEEDDEEARRAHRTLVTGLERGDPALRAHLPLVTARTETLLAQLLILSAVTFFCMGLLTLVQEVPDSDWLQPCTLHPVPCAL